MTLDTLWSAQKINQKIYYCSALLDNMDDIDERVVKRIDEETGTTAASDAYTDFKNKLRALVEQKKAEYEKQFEEL